MSKTLIEIPDPILLKLNRLAKNQHVSRASLIREAIESWLKTKAKPSKTDAFGLLKGKVSDGVAFQRQLRKEW